MIEVATPNPSAGLIHSPKLYCHQIIVVNCHWYHVRQCLFVQHKVFSRSLPFPPGQLDNWAPWLELGRLTIEHLISGHVFCIWASYLGFCDIVLSRRRCTWYSRPEKGKPMRSTWDKVFSLDTPGLISWTWCLDLISQIISYPGSLWSIIVCASYKVSPRKFLKMFFGRCLKAGQLTGQHERHQLRETVWEYRRRKSPEGVLCLR